MPRNMDDQLGDGGMPLLDTLGVRFDEYGEGWAGATWTPTDPCVNPIGVVQAGVHAVVLDAACNFALLAGLERGEHGVTIEMKVANMRAAIVDDVLKVRADALRIGGSVAHLEATVSTDGGEVVSKASATFAVQRT
ncbi:MAG: PaaI family thioesterase [Acidimicrobiia bacterium]|nr:PaaI family thioesterase [Acidimicrobiia bacterium]